MRDKELDKLAADLGKYDKKVNIISRYGKEISIFQIGSMKKIRMATGLKRWKHGLVTQSIG